MLGASHLNQRSPSICNCMNEVNNSLRIPVFLPILAECLHTPYATFLSWDSTNHPSLMNEELICFSSQRGKNLTIISYDLPGQIYYWTKCYLPDFCVSISLIKSYPNFKNNSFFFPPPHKEHVFAIKFIFTTHGTSLYRVTELKPIYI